MFKNWLLFKKIHSAYTVQKHPSNNLLYLTATFSVQVLYALTVDMRF